MQPILWSFVSIIAYIGGLIAIAKVTPMLLLHSFDEGLFMGIATVDIMSAILVFGAVGVTYALFNGAIPIRVLDFLLLTGILLVAIRQSLAGLQIRVVPKTSLPSRIITGGYGLFLAVAAIYGIIQIFTLPS